MKQEDFLIAVSSDYKRTVPEDVTLFNENTRNQKTLFEQYPSHAESLKERARAAFAIHLITTPYYLQKIRGNAQHITEKILQAVNHNE